MKCVNPLIIYGKPDAFKSQGHNIGPSCSNRKSDNSNLQLNVTLSKTGYLA